MDAAAIDQLRVQITSQLTQQFEAEITTLRNGISALQAELANRPAARPKPSLPDPEKFDGKGYKYETWFQSIEAKLLVDGPAIGNEIAQFYYVYLNLETNVQAMVLPQLAAAKEADVWDPQSIIRQITRVYDNPNKVLEAEDRLHKIEMSSTESLHAYIARFERMLYEARGANWDDSRKISAFRIGLTSTLRTRLRGQLTLPKVYDEFVRVVQQLGQSGGPPPTSDRDHRPAGKLYEPMDTTVGAININAINPDLVALEASPSSSRARSISPLRREQLRKEGRCVRCGSHDHWVNRCPLEPYSRSSSRSRSLAQRSPSPADLAALRPTKSTHRLSPAEALKKYGHIKINGHTVTYTTDDDSSVEGYDSDPSDAEFIDQGIRELQTS
jgi:hypothetical protein